VTAARLIDFRPPRIAQSLTLLALLLHWATPLGDLSVTGLPIAGTLLGLTGFLLMLRAWWLFRQAATAICPTAASSRLITDDVYRLTRNPMYLGMEAMLLGLALAMGTLPFYAAATAFVLLIDRVFIPFEEEKMTREFGDAYSRYCERTRRWL